MMRIGVTHKLFLAILMAAGLAVISSALIMQWSLDRGFLKFVNSMEKSGISRLAAQTRSTVPDRTELGFSPARNRPSGGDWLPNPCPRNDGHRENMLPMGPPPEHDGAHQPKPLSPHMIRHFDQRLFLLDADKKVLLSRVAKPVDNSATPLTCQGRVVGYLGLLPRTKLSDAPQQRFLKEQKWTFALIAGVLVLLSAAIGAASGQTSGAAAQRVGKSDPSTGGRYLYHPGYRSRLTMSWDNSPMISIHWLWPWKRASGTGANGLPISPMSCAPRWQCCGARSKRCKTASANQTGRRFTPCMGKCCASPDW